MADQGTTRDIVLRLEGKMDSIIEMVRNHDVDLNGNGKPGVKSDLRLLHGRVEIIEDTHKEQKKFGNQVKVLAIGQILTLVGLMIALIFGLK